MPKFYLNLGYKLKKKALCYSHLNNTVDILDRNIVMDYFRHENHWQSSQKKNCLLYTSPSPRDQRGSRMPSSA